MPIDESEGPQNRYKKPAESVPRRHSRPVHRYRQGPATRVYVSAQVMGTSLIRPPAPTVPKPSRVSHGTANSGQFSEVYRRTSRKTRAGPEGAGMEVFPTRAQH